MFTRRGLLLSQDVINTSRSSKIHFLVGEDRILLLKTYRKRSYQLLRQKKMNQKRLLRARKDKGLGVECWFCWVFF